MIITLKGADFSSNNIGTLTTWPITYNLKNVTCDTSVTTVDREAAFTATFVYDDSVIGEYNENNEITITMGGTQIYPGDDSIIKFSIAANATPENMFYDGFILTIPEVTGNLVITAKQYAENENITSNVTLTYKYGTVTGSQFQGYTFTEIADSTTRSVPSGGILSYSTIIASAPTINGYEATGLLMGSTIFNSTSMNSITLTNDMTFKIVYPAAAGEEEPDTPDNPSLTLYQGYANENNIAELATRVRTDFIEGAFSVECNSGYVIRAIYQYNQAAATGGTSIVASSDNKTSYTGGTTGKYYIITFCKSDATANISPTEDIVASFTGTIYSGNNGGSGSGNVTGETIEVNGIRIAMGQILGSGLKTDHTGRAYTVDTLNDKTTISTDGSNFVMIPIIDMDSDLTNGSITLYTNTDGSFATSSSAGGTLTYHDTITIADIKAVDSTAKIYMMFKHKTASTFVLSDLASAITIS